MAVVQRFKRLLAFIVATYGNDKISNQIHNMEVQSYEKGIIKSLGEIMVDVQSAELNISRDKCMGVYFNVLELSENMRDEIGAMIRKTYVNGEQLAEKPIVDEDVTFAIKIEHGNKDMDSYMTYCFDGGKMVIVPLDMGKYADEIKQVIMEIIERNFF